MSKAVEARTTPAAIAAMLAPFFPRWKGDASEPALPAPAPRLPKPAAPRALVVA